MTLSRKTLNRKPNNIYLTAKDAVFFDRKSTARKKNLALVGNRCGGWLLIFLLMLFTSDVVAQGVQYNAGKSDYNLRSSGTVNPSTLALELNIPLGGYPGRAGMDLPVSINYSSKVWQMEYAGHEGVNPHGAGWSTPVYAAKSTGGWNISLAPLIIESADISRTFTSQGFPAQGAMGSSNTYSIRRLLVRFPNGSTSEFRMSDVPVNAGGSSATGTYYAVDGSGMKLDYNVSTPSTLYLPDGSKFVYTLNGLYWNTEYIDRHGNKQVYDPQQKQWTDTMGRTVSANFTNALAPGYDIGLPTQTVAGDKTYSLPGKGTTSLNYIFRWRKLKDTATGESVLSDPLQSLPYRANYTFCDGAAFSIVSPSLFTNGGGGLICNSGDELFNPVVLSEIELPNGQKYQFKYNIYGEIEIVHYPTGGYEKFFYGQIQTVSYLRTAYALTNRGVVERRVSTDGVTEQQVWQYSAGYSNPPSTYKVTTTAPDGTRSERYLHWSNTQNPFDLGNGLDGMAYDERVYAPQSAGGGLLRRTLTEWAGVATYNYAYQYPRGAKVVKVVEATAEINSPDALTRTKTFAYDLYGNNTLSSDYDLTTISKSAAETADINSIAAGGALGSSETEYQQSGDYLGRWLIGLPKRVEIKSGTGATLSLSEIKYDETTYPLIGAGTAVNWSDPQTTARGNATTLRTWVQETNSWIETHAQFDNFGNLRKQWDSSNDATRFIETEYSAQHHYAYPTKIKAPAPDPTGVHGMTEGSEITRTFDSTTGLPLTVTDANGQIATTEYDNLLRPIRVNPPAGGSVSEKIYNDDPNDLWVKTRQQIDEVNWAEQTTFFDRAGRVYKTRTKDLQGDVFSEIRYDNLGRVEKTSNPYRQGEQILWSKPRYDDINRVIGGYAPAPDGQTGASVGEVEFGISTVANFVGTYVVAKDASGRKARTISGVYGILRIDEATGIGGTTDADLGTLENPHQPTFYTYNVKGELTKITQGDPSQPGQTIQNRFFMYDSLGRLTRVRQPEQTANPHLATTGNPENNQWTAGYTYDVFGNVVKMTDAKGINIINEYDKAGRATTRCYTKAAIQTTATLCSQLTSNETSTDTAQVDYYYDGKGLGLAQAPPFSRGALTKTASTVSENRYTSFDNHGRLLTSEQRTDGQTYNFSYKYNLSGGLVEETYPSGRVVKTILDADGGLATVSSRAGNGNQFKTYATGFDYAASGAVKKMMLGNGLWETAQMNERFQLTQIGLGTAPTDKSLFKVDYEYGELSQDGLSVDSVKNVGNIARQTTTIPTTSFTQTYRYDANDRLTEARETTNGTQNWKQTFGYDRFGNRTNFSQIVGATQMQLNSITHPTIDQTNNRFTTGQGYVYDYNGNLIQDAEGRTFIFNADDKQIEVRNTNDPPNAPPIGKYFYDGDGARVKKVTNSETTIFVYDAGGKLAAEYSTAAPPTTPQTNYLTTDHLGSPRVITDKQGQVTARRDFMPFGEEIGTGIGGRTQTLKYSMIGADNTRQRFTGYEKDVETDLDFAEARMYQNRHGRFTAVDPLLASANLKNPQTFNRYAYVNNNPVNLTDPSGLCPVGGCEPYVGPVYRRIIDGVTYYSATQDEGYEPFTGDVTFNDRDSGVLTQVTANGWQSVNQSEVVNVEAEAVLQQMIGGELSLEFPSQRAPTPMPAPAPTPLYPAGGTYTDLAVSPEGVGQAAAAAPLIISYAAAAGTDEFPVLGTGIGVAAGTLAVIGLMAANSVRIQERPYAVPTSTPAPTPQTPSNRGRIQIQGSNPPLEASAPWSQTTPPTKSQGLLWLNGLWNSLSRSAQRDRNRAYQDAVRFINRCPKTGCPAQPGRTFQDPSRRDSRARIDIEIWTGVAFID